MELDRHWSTEPAVPCREPLPDRTRGVALLRTPHPYSYSPLAMNLIHAPFASPPSSANHVPWYSHRTVSSRVLRSNTRVACSRFLGSLGQGVGACSDRDNNAKPSFTSSVRLEGLLISLLHNYHPSISSSRLLRNGSCLDC